MSTLCTVGNKVLDLDRLVFIQPTKNKLYFHCFFKDTDEILWLTKVEFEALQNYLKGMEPVIPVTTK